MKLFCFLFLVAVVTSLSNALSVQAQDQSGFISLDCGAPKGTSYEENTTTLSYVSDENFIDTGVGTSIKEEYILRFQQQYRYVRSFVDGVKNCYNLKLGNKDKYLIRASFLYGNYDGLNKTPTFDVYLGPNLWDSVKLKDATTPKSLEIVHVPLSSNFHVCVAKTGDSIPFISSLELRLLPNDTYQAETGSLEAITRLDMGSTNLTKFRFKEDFYDRTWLPANYTHWSSISTSKSIQYFNSFKSPQLAMKTAYIPKISDEPMTLVLDVPDKTSKLYVYMYFAEIQELKTNESREIKIMYNGQLWYGPFSPVYLSTTTVKSVLHLDSLNGKYEFSIQRTKKSTQPPLLNAVEVYRQKLLIQQDTDQADVDAIMKIKALYGKIKWQGDPCSPQDYAWDGLSCTYNNSNPPRITSLNLSSGGLTGRIAYDIHYLTQLTILDLSDNNLSGSFPEFLSQMAYLTVLDISGNKLSGSVPAALLNRERFGSLKLSFEGNPDLCPCEKKSHFLLQLLVALFSFFVVGASVSVFFMCKRRRKRISEATRYVSFKSGNVHDSELAANRKFSYSEILKITHNFKRVLGKGGFGIVYHGYLEGNQVAVKLLSHSSVQGYKEFRAEVELLLRVHHRYLVNIIGYCDQNDTLALVYEYMANGDLRNYLSGKNGSNILSWEARLKIAREAAQGLEYLHSGCKPQIVHRDVKTSNILLDEHLQAKLADFGLSKSFSVEGDTHMSTNVAGTPGYVDPEYYRSNWLTEKSDVHSFGVVLLEIITNQLVIDHNREQRHISDWVSSMIEKGDLINIADPKLKGDFNHNSAWKAIEIALSCVSCMSSKRPTMTSVVIELNECLAEGNSRIQGYDRMDTNDSMEVSLNDLTDLSPGVR